MNKNKMNKKIVYQSAILIVLYIGYGFYFFTRKSFIFMLPYFHINETSTFNLTKNQIGKKLKLWRFFQQFYLIQVL